MKRIGWLPLILSGCASQPAIAPERIVSNNPCIDSVLAEIAAPDQIAAVSIYSHDEASTSAPIEWARTLPALGTSAEEIIAARPALVLTGNLASSGTNAALARAGIKIVTIGVPATLADNDAQIRTIARAIGRTAAGEALIARIADATKPQHRSTKQPKALIWQTSGFVAGKGTVQDELLTRAGYRNAASSYGLKQWDMLPLETVLRDPPAVIFMPTKANGDDARNLTARNRVLAHVRTRVRVAAFPDKLLYCGGPTVITAMAALRRAAK